MASVRKIEYGLPSGNDALTVRFGIGKRIFEAKGLDRKMPCYQVGLSGLSVVVALLQEHGGVNCPMRAEDSANLRFQPLLSATEAS